MPRAIRLEPISRSSVAAFKALRLAALGELPTAYGSTLADESRLSDAQWLARAEACEGDANAGFLAIVEGVACGLVRGTPDDRDPGVGWVESMWVAPAHRRRGIGRILVGEITAWAGRRGMRALKLSVTSGNDPAIQLYQRLGFSFTGSTEPHPLEAGLVEREMLLELQPEA